ncbi:homeobox domain protein [Onchocerca flexuosa]|uniref:Homeobox domain protein n=1 Tax=Onchocerca flexuosa TaxID=387005 RepID=A0A238C370_9BILA|nr:homeobox domain protein [Onchocerca flexuosa]
MAASITIGHPSFSAFKPNDTTTCVTTGLDKSVGSVNMTATTRRRQRTTFTSVQADTLEKEYLTDQYMPRSRRLLIARSLGLNESQVKTWFQNRRAKDKRNDKNAILLRSILFFFSFICFFLSLSIRNSVLHTNSNTSSPPGSSPEVNENSAALIQQLCSQTLNPIQLTL